MKIYYIANARMPTERAHGIQIAKMCEAFIEQGFDLKLIVPRRRTSSESLARFYNLRVPVSTVRLPALDWYASGRFGFFVASLSFMISYFFYMWYKKISGQGGIVYTIDIDQFSFLFVPFLGMPYYAEIHDAKKKTFAFSALFRRARGVIVINKRIKETLRKEFGIPPGRIAVHPNGVDTEKFGHSIPDARKKLGLPAGTPIAMYVGKLYGWKGAEILADAAKRAKDILFYIVGGTAEEFASVTGISSLPENLICVGQKKYDEMPLWMHAADVLLVLGTKENDYSYLHTSPMKMFEYMATGKPIVAAQTPANEEIVSSEEVVFYAPDNADDLAKKVKYARTMPSEVLKEKVEKTREKAETLSWKNRAKSIVSFMEMK